jgi:protoporphyrinogen oxidase
VVGNFCTMAANEIVSTCLFPQKDSKPNYRSGEEKRRKSLEANIGMEVLGISLVGWGP